MGPVANALSQGYSVKDVIAYLMKSDPKMGERISKALSSGYSEDEVIEYLKGNYATSKAGKKSPKSFIERQTLRGGMTAAERTSRAMQSEKRSGVGGVIGQVAGQSLPLLALGGTAGMLSKTLGPLAGMAGSYVMNKLQGAGTTGTAPTPGAPVSAPTTPGAPPVSPTTPSPSAAEPSAGTFLQQFAEPVMKAFGFKNKPLIDFVGKIAKATGDDVQKIYRDLQSKGDLSTPEKAAKAAQERLAEVTGAKAEGKPIAAKTSEQTREDLASQLKSSVVRQMKYEPKDKKLKIIFNSGATYLYHDFPEDKWKSLSAGGTPAKTHGKNEFGVWWVGKNPSVGATFNEIIQPRKKEGGPFKYERVSDTPLSEQEMKELEEIQKPASAKATKYVEAEEKTQEAARRTRESAGATKALTPKQIVDRTRTLTKAAESLKAKEPTERTAEALSLIEDRLKMLKYSGEILARKGKKGFVAEEIERFEKSEGEKLVKKLITILPKSIAKVLVDKVGSMKERDLLMFIKDYFKSKR